jgi:hypothetical protein
MWPFAGKRSGPSAEALDCGEGFVRAVIPAVVEEARKGVAHKACPRASAESHDTIEIFKRKHERRALRFFTWHQQPRKAMPSQRVVRNSQIWT